MKLRKVTALALTGMLMISLMVLLPASAASESLSSVNNQLEDKKNQLEEGKKKQNELVAQLNELNTQLEQIDQEIAAIDENIAAKEQEVQDARKSLEEKQQEIDEQNRQLGLRLRAMYKTGDIGMLEVLLGSDSVAELVSNIEMFQKIYNHDVGVLEKIQEQYDVISEKKISLEKLRDQLRAQQNEKKASEQTLESKKSDIEALEAQVSKDNEALEAQIDELNQQAANLTAQMQQGSIAASSSGTSEYLGGTMLWPVPSSQRVTSEYGSRFHPILQVHKFHSGIDIGAPQGDQILAASDGTVIYSAMRGGYGYCVMIDHGGGVVTVYGHCSKLLVSAGQAVTRGETIALVGSTGMSTGPHCHFEVRVNGSTTNPMPYLS